MDPAAAALLVLADCAEVHGGTAEGFKHRLDTRQIAITQGARINAEVRHRTSDDGQPQRVVARRLEVEQPRGREPRGGGVATAGSRP